MRADLARHVLDELTVSFVEAAIDGDYLEARLPAQRPADQTALPSVGWTDQYVASVKQILLEHGTLLIERDDEAGVAQILTEVFQQRVH